MRHGVFGKQLSRTSNERVALRRNLMRSLFLHGAIKTTKAKAIAVRSDVEKLITKAKRKTDASNLSRLPDRQVVKSIISMADTRFAGRNSGYTRITKIGARLGDASEQVILSFVDEEVKAEVITPKKDTKTVVASEKKETAAKKTTPKKTVEKPKKVTKKETK